MCLQITKSATKYIFIDVLKIINIIKTWYKFLLRRYYSLGTDNILFQNLIVSNIIYSRCYKLFN